MKRKIDLNGVDDDAVSTPASSAFRRPFSWYPTSSRSPKNVLAQTPRWSTTRIPGPADGSARTRAPLAIVTSPPGRASANTGVTPVARRAKSRLRTTWNDATPRPPLAPALALTLAASRIPHINTPVRAPPDLTHTSCHIRTVSITRTSSQSILHTHVRLATLT